MNTTVGYRVSLERVDTPSWYGQDIQLATLDVEYHTEHRLRLKVSYIYITFIQYGDMNPLYISTCDIQIDS